jgi:hypothetical protein
MAMTSPFRGLFASLMLAVCFSGINGCSRQPQRPPTFPVSGTVTLKGQPLEGARIVLVPTTPGVEGCAAVSDAQGKFQVTTFSQGDGAQAGSYGIQVTKYDGKPPSKEDQVRHMTEEEEQKVYFPDEKPTPPAKNLLSKKYQLAATSGLTLTVTNKPETLTIALE